MAELSSAMIAARGGALATDLTEHVEDLNNPHGVTAVQAGAQPVHANLTAIAGQTTAANKLSYWSGSGAASLADFTAAARTLLDDTTTAAMRATLGAEPAITAGSAAQLLAGDKSLIAQTALPIQTLVQTELDNLQDQIDGISVGSAAGVHVCTGVGDGVTNDYAALVAMFAATGDGEIAQLKPGKNYLCSSNITTNLGSKSIIFDGNGSTITFDNYANRMLFQSAFVNIQTMSSMASDGYSVVCSDASVYRLKEPVRIYSNDATTGAHSSSFYRAEDIILENVDTGTDELFFRRPSLSKTGGGLMPAYTTSPKIAQRSGKTLIIKDLTVNHSSGAASGFTSFALKAMVEIEGFTNPILSNVSSKRAFLPGILTRACYNAIILGGVDGWHDDTNISTDVNTFGYGVTDCSTGTRILYRSAYRVRHAIDTSEQSGLGSTPQYYGTSANMRVIGCRADNCTETAFTSHHSCRDLMYIGCVAVNCGNPTAATNPAGNNTGYAFGIRGQVTLVNCSDYNCLGGWHVFDEDTRTPAYSWAEIRGYRSYGSGPSRNQNHVTPVNVYDMTCTDTTTYNPAWLVQNFADGVTRLHGTTRVKPMLLTAFNSIIGPNSLGLIEFDKIILDLSEVANQTSSYIFDVQGNGATSNNITLRGSVLRILGAGASTVFKYNASNLPDADQLRFKLCCDDGVLEYSGSAQNNTTDMQLNGSNNLAAMGDVTIINSIDRFKDNQRTETVTISFGSILTTAVASGTATVNGFKSGDAITCVGTCASAGLEFVKATVSSDNTITVYVRNITSTATYDSQSIKLVLTR